eukprot:jgi/Galph1/6044/GphlegSOOS_G4675.1
MWNASDDPSLSKMEKKRNIQDIFREYLKQYEDSIDRVLFRSSLGGILGAMAGVGRAVYYERKLVPELIRCISRYGIVSLHFFGLKEVCDRLKGKETIWSTFFAGGFTGWFYGLLRSRHTVSTSRSFLLGVMASSIGLLTLRGLEESRDYMVFQWEQGAETENELYLLRLYHHLIGEDKELDRLRAKRDRLYMEILQLQDNNKNESRKTSIDLEANQKKE